MRRNNGPSEPCPRQRHHENQQLASINITLITQSLSLRFDENRIRTSTKSTVWHPCISPACQTWVSSLRRNWDIPRFEPPAVAPQGELMNIKQIAAALGVANSTVHRWLNQGIIAGEQLTPGAPWRIRLTDDLRDRVAEEAPDDFLTMYQTMRLLGVSRQTVWQRVKRGEIKALHVRRGRKKGLRLKVIRSQSDLFDQTAQTGV